MLTLFAMSKPDYEAEYFKLSEKHSELSSDLTEYKNEIVSLNMQVDFYKKKIEQKPPKDWTMTLFGFVAGILVSTGVWVFITLMV